AMGEDLMRYSRKLKHDFAAIVNGTFRTTDLFTDLSNGEILVIFTNTDCDNAKVAFTRLNDSLNHLLKKPVKIEYALLDLARDNERLEALWERLN
ncbi:MAG: hypothetical protein D6743_17755, partial [Calditrichaeota bacterium]